MGVGNFFKANFMVTFFGNSPTNDGEFSKGIHGLHSNLPGFLGWKMLKLRVFRWWICSWDEAINGWVTGNSTSWLFFQGWFFRNEKWGQI